MGKSGNKSKTRQTRETSEANLVNGDKYCGAKTRKGTPCKGLAMANGRCRMHGGTAGKRTGLNRHGLLTRFLPAEALEIVQSADCKDPEGILDEAIAMHLAAIMRSQKIMFVKDADDDKRDVVMQSETATTYKTTHALDRQATFLQAHSKAVRELAKMIEVREAMRHTEEDALKIERLRADIARLKKETEQGGVIKVVFEDADNLSG